ncbi:predicted protein [Brucella suis bv. 3 str. 686]|nr:hypothetical protein BCA52141_I3260 [Brucella canis HSK A52141]AEW17649.1 hypothetical protein BAA13334_I02059 [Brucella abortus A13334]AIB17932.1 Hypothetical protein BSSP3_I1215 [Brucella suis bv. 2]EEW90869.1 predicted protein [Brucella suis bv. 4 str. 40]EEY32844.1 predicted protein [Brucella suis bv. 3 str. 686]
MRKGDCRRVTAGRSPQFFRVCRLRQQDAFWSENEKPGLERPGSTLAKCQNYNQAAMAF